MTIARSVAEVIDEHFTLQFECIDRMYLNMSWGEGSYFSLGGFGAGVIWAMDVGIAKRLAVIPCAHVARPKGAPVGRKHDATSNDAVAVMSQVAIDDGAVLVIPRKLQYWLVPSVGLTT